MINLRARLQIQKTIDSVKNNLLYSFCELRDLLSSHHQLLPNDAIDAILDMFIVCLESASFKIPTDQWQKANTHYFAGNCGSSQELRNKFMSGSFGIDDLIKCVETARNNKDYQFLLRNPEVVLRDDVSLDDATIKLYSCVFVSILEDIAKL